MYVSVLYKKIACKLIKVGFLLHWNPVNLDTNMGVMEWDPLYLQGGHGVGCHCTYRGVMGQDPLYLQGAHGVGPLYLLLAA